MRSRVLKVDLGALTAYSGFFLIPCERCRMDELLLGKGRLILVKNFTKMLRDDFHADNLPPHF
jgi:hypothetical protein